MAENVVLLDIGVLIDHVRSQKKETTFFYRLNEQYSLAMSVITGFELLIGRTERNGGFTDAMLSNIPILGFDQNCMSHAVTIYRVLKKRNKLI